MSISVEKLEKNMAKLTIEVSAEEFEKALVSAYNKNKGKMSVPGFRKGKVPMQMIEKIYGVGIFYEDAANELIPVAYSREVKDCDLDIVSQPTIDIVQIGKGKSFIFTAEVAVKPEVELGKYKGLKVEKTKVEVTDEDIDAELNRVREQNSRTIPVEDRAVVDGDIAVIDFEGFVDGVAFEGGKGTDYSLVIGSHSFIDTFEEQLIGKNIGEEVEVNVTFPEEYHAEALKGKPAMFKVVVKEIKAKELPELDDDFAQDVSEFDTLAEYKEDIKKNLLERKEKAAKTDIENKAIEMIVEDAKMEIPDAMIEAQARQMADDFMGRLGVNAEQYFAYTGMTEEKMLEDLKPQALKRIQSRLVLEAIVAAEKIEATDEDVDKEIAEMAAMYKMETAKLKELMGEKEIEAIKLDAAVAKAVDLVVASVK